MTAKAKPFRTLLVLPVVVLAALAVAMAAVAIVSGAGLAPAYADETSPPTEDVWAWGYNYSGQLGDGTTTNSTTSVQVGGLSGVKDVAGGKDTVPNLYLQDDVGGNWGGYHNLALSGDVPPPPDYETAPTVSSVYPASGETGASRTTDIVARFSEKMDPATLTTSTVTLGRV